jgi:hypothetical protein
MSSLPVAPPRRRHRTARRLVIAALILIALLVAADRIGCLVAERIAADTLQESQHLEHRPDVHIDGFPFLTQLAFGHFGQVRASSHDVGAGSGDRSLRIARISARLRDVDVSRDFTRATAGTLRATGTIAFADLSSALGLPVRYAGGGRVEAAASVTVAGQRISGSVSAVPEVVDQSLRFTQPRIRAAGGTVPQPVSSALAAVFGAPLSLAGLPYGLRVEDVHATPDGLTITLSAAHLTFER